MLAHQDNAGILWTPRQQRALIWVVALLLVALAARWGCNRALIDDPQPEVAARAAELADRLDPNRADWRELAAIPMLGGKRARAIVAFRESWRQAHPGEPAFRGPEDLRKVKGIGQATAANLTPYLIFPKRAISATQGPGT